MRIIPLGVGMIKRDVAGFVLDNASWFPVVSVTGPRQSGKSTLVSSLFSDYAYVNLEDRPTYERVMAGPSDFIHERPPRMIINEAQRVPELFNAIQVVSDERGTVGQYILLGSQNYLLLRRITQSLAGRIGLVRLMPLSYREVALVSSEVTPDGFMLRGGYPRLYDVDTPSYVYFENYISTYVERDVSEYVDARSKGPFRRLLMLCAQSCGSLLNVSRLASDLGVARATIDSWLSILEASYTVFRLQPYHANLRKRLTRTPRVYFCDTGLLCHLLGVETSEQLRDSEMRGAIFENLIVTETAKRHLNAGRTPRLFFYRDDSKIEVDLVDDSDPAGRELIEIKSQVGFRKDFLRHLPVVGGDLGIAERWRYVVTRGADSFFVGGMKVWAARDWLMRP